MSSFFSKCRPAAKHLVGRLAVIFLLLVSGSRSYAQKGEDGKTPATPAADTLTAQVAEWSRLKIVREHKHGDDIREVLLGSTRDLSSLDIHAYTLPYGNSRDMNSEEDALVIVKEGSLTVTIDSVTHKVLGPGGIALIPADEFCVFGNMTGLSTTYYIFRFRSKSVVNRERARKAGPPILIDWKEMVMKKTDKGESRQIFDRPVAWLGRIDMHATTLNAGEVSHPPHIHRAEEIILMRSGNVQEYIGGKYYKATAGDLIFLPSGVPHAVENKSNERCEYFALQWML